jgi:hypothetical protein
MADIVATPPSRLIDRHQESVKTLDAAESPRVQRKLLPAHAQ